jgi:hypothetical protein
MNPKSQKRRRKSGRGKENNYIWEGVRRNIQRFPKDFMFELTKTEYISLRSHFGMLKRGEHAKCDA